jgi:uncharacterized protein YhbP (UPF0306 family)
MSIRRSGRRISGRRLAELAGSLLAASPLCAIATVGPGQRAHVNTAYFASGPELELVWLSEPRAAHSRNVRRNETAAVAVYDSRQTWGEPDRGIQLFGAAREADGAAEAEARRVYAARFPDAERAGLAAYRFYVFRPRRLKLFDERELGTGVYSATNEGRGRGPRRTGSRAR